MGKFSDVYVDADFAEDQTLIALHVNATGETPDRGGRTMEEAFLQQFVGKKAPFELGNGVDAVSGPTVTSTAVIEAINEAAKGFDPTVPFSTGK